MASYSKAIVALLGGIASWGLTAGADSQYSSVELWGLLAAVATGIGVYAKSNTPEGTK